jgi:hypothetical protein
MCPGVGAVSAEGGSDCVYFAVHRLEQEGGLLMSLD